MTRTYWFNIGKVAVTESFRKENINANITMKPYIALILMICTNLGTGVSKRVKDKIYVNIDEANTAPCFRRLNGTHQIGCSSEPKGNVGTVHFVNDSSDLTWVLESGPHHPYAVLLKATDFNVTTLNKLSASGRVNGVMVIHVLNPTNESDLYGLPPDFSPDKSCPNDQYGLYGDKTEYAGCSKVKWNPFGNNMMFQDYKFPIVILTNEENIDFVLNKCYKAFNEPINGVAKDYPICAVQLKDRMDAAKNSEVCIRRSRHQLNLNPDKYCDPMGDKNVFATVKFINNTDNRPNKSVIVAAARMDSFSMFENDYPSADNHVSGIVALLAAAEAIGKVKDEIKDSPNDILFTFFQGEAWDYIGSGRMVYDMEGNQFPEQRGSSIHRINLEHISHLVEVNQLAYRDNGKVWIHTDPLTRPNVSEKVDEMVKMLKELDSTLVDEAPSSNPLPPASVQSFLKKRPLPAVVITDHQNEFTNKFYNSRLDIAHAIRADYGDLNRTLWYDHVTEQAQNLTEVATLMARYLYRLATNDNSTENITADSMTVTHLLYCFLFSPKCELFTEVFDKENADSLKETPYPFYVGINWQTNHVTTITGKLLMRFLGERTNITSEACDNTISNHSQQSLFRYDWMQGPLNENGTRTPFCMYGTAGLSLASSIAFEKDDYDYTSREYSTWTESSWQSDAINVRFFLLPSKALEVSTLVAGVLILLISLFMGYFLDAKSSTLFSTPSPDSPNQPVAL